MRSDHLCIFCPRMGMGDLITFIGLFKTINKESGKKLIIITKESTSGKQYLLDEPYCADVIYLPKHKRGLLNFFESLKDFFSLVKTAHFSYSSVVIKYSIIVSKSSLS